MPRLFVLPQVDGDTPFELDDHLVLVGREPDSLLQIEDRNISKHHALLLRVEDSYRVFDLHSSNGTYVNEERVEIALLKDGDVLQFGSAQFRFESGPPRKKVGLKPGGAGGLGARPTASKPVGISVAPATAAATPPEAVPLPPLPTARPAVPLTAMPVLPVTAPPAGPLPAKPLAAKPLVPGAVPAIPVAPVAAPPTAVPEQPAVPTPVAVPPVPVAAPAEGEQRMKVMIPRKPLAGPPPSQPAGNPPLDAKETQDAAPAMAKVAKPAIPAVPAIPSVPPAAEQLPPAVIDPASVPGINAPQRESPQAADEDGTKPKRLGLGGKPAGGGGGEIRLKLKR